MTWCEYAFRPLRRELGMWLLLGIDLQVGTIKYEMESVYLEIEA